MNYDIACMYCHHVKHNNEWYNQKDYKKLKTANQVSHGVCESDICVLEHAMKGSGIMDAEKELPQENRYLLDELILIFDAR